MVITLRNLHKSGLYSTINIIGLSIGIASSLLIWLWVSDETSFDKFVPKSDKLYQVWVNAAFDGKINSWKSVPLPTYEAMKSADAHIVRSAVASWQNNHLLTVGDNRIIKNGYYVSEEFLEMFEFPLISGNAETVLDDPSSIVLTRSFAKVLFGDQEALGNLVMVDDESSLKVTGILEDLPGNSSFEFEYLIPWKHRESINPWVRENKNNWGNYSFQVFVELDDSSQEQEVENNIKDMLTKNGEDDMPRAFFLHPMQKWRLHSSFKNGKESGGMSDYVQLFTVIAVFIILIACINFMNLATARSEHRAREVGIRKSLGSYKYQLILQFIGESILISFIAFMLAILWAQVLLPAYNDLVEKELIIDYSAPSFWISAIAIIVITGVFSGSYPAFFLSSFKPATTLKGKVRIGKSSGLPRQILVVLQFGFSILLLISTIVIFKQIELVKNRELGYEQENLIFIENTDDIAENYESLKLELLQSGTVEAVTRSNSAITSINSNNFLGWPGKPESQKVIFTTIATEYDYAKTMGIEVLYGRDFSKDFATDTGAIVINRAALELMGLEDPIGTNLDLWGGKKKLIGVVDDVLMGSPYQPVKPMFMILDKEWIGYISVRLKKTSDLQASLAVAQSIFEKHNPAYPFEYKFADVEFEKKFSTIYMTRKLASLFSLLAIFITGLGLFGLASFAAEQRIKEVSIRKVLGASVSSLVTLISKDFTYLVLIAFALSAPLAWYFLNQYLERYQIRTNIDWWIFPVSGLFALIFTVIIVANQAWRAAHTNPANALRNE